MKERLKNLEQALAVRLQQELPGQQAHDHMSIQGRKERMFQANKKDARRSAVLMMLYYKESTLHIPLIRRPQYDGVHGGQMALPGGKVEESDTSLAATALRETMEEVGVHVTENQVVGALTELYIPPSHLLVTPYVALLEKAPQFLIDPKEVDRVFEMPLADFLNKEKHLTRSVTVMGNIKLQVPAFYIAEQTVWGATAMMMSELLHLLQELDYTE